MYAKNTTLCYIEKDGAYLMMHRTKKKNDENEGKWIGIGGKTEYGESPFDCARREIGEETGFSVKRLFYRGIITFVLGESETEYMHLFTSDSFSGTLCTDCDEGELAWIEKERLTSLPLWEGDRLFLDLLARDERRFFSLKLVYSPDGKLISYTLEFAE